MPETRMVVVRGDQPEYLHNDVDGDFLFITTAAIPGQGAGVYFRTARMGSSVPVGDLDNLIDRLREIAAAATASVEG